MASYDWNAQKNEKLKLERGISFDEVVDAMDSGKLLDVIDTPNQTKHKGQKMFVVEIDDYVYLVPFVENQQGVFLKTIFPSRKATKEYLIERRTK